MRFSWDFLQNMLENGHSKLQNKLVSAYHFKYFQNNPIQKSRDRTNAPYLPTLNAYSTPGVGGRFIILSLKWKVELEGTRSNFTPWLCDFEHQGENC